MQEKYLPEKEACPAAAAGAAPTVEWKSKIDILSPLTVIVFIFSQLARFVLRVLLFLMVFIGVTVFLWLRRGQMWLHELVSNFRGAAAMRLQRRQMRIHPLTVAAKQQEGTSSHTSTQLPMDQEDRSQPDHQDASPGESDWNEGLGFSWNWNFGYALSSLLRIDFSRCWFLLWRFGSRR
ncbi:hypothetical protein F1559_001756 [Cyanidiococcus yangmingshanensis]|uniref:Uncharacterized protein n=1 Tax=Cyanidiococcus yangmingshanensis TaxID=2690220 RepID=A0A7J7IFA9_9RHOD|nr:hypothetical protein F1559_001756 [Cyanidiococcus yangmingshanensis]